MLKREAERLELEVARVDARIRDLNRRRLELEEQLEAARRKQADEPTFWPKRYDFYLHSSKEGNCEVMEDSLEKAGVYIPEDDDFWRQLCYACYEVEINCLVHRDGNVEIVGVNGKKLSEKAVEPTEL